MIIGMHPYLVLNGNGQEAVKFYEKALNAKVLNVQTFGDMPGNPESQLPEEAKNLVLNAHLKVGNTDLMLSDTFPGQSYQVGGQVTVALLVNDPDESREIFGKLEDGGHVAMALQETFWSPLYGQVTDKFGVTWQVSTQTEEEK
ncbi:VOC family protein [Heyndrickxia acidicola]|uniref:VOC family protein n=1 Tax=Heyndrickxia acidicola TaxID=209389 RepID=A0ABU6MMX0_9BACI|nr:VOC family protein [Heyndrickxia acidicola]MED1205326.1 VOC family protein [Heyndrickxia acidicola]